MQKFRRDYLVSDLQNAVSSVEEHAREFQRVGSGEIDVGEVLTVHDALVEHERGGRTSDDRRLEFGPRVVLGRHLGQRSGREARRAVDHLERGPLRRGLQREAVRRVVGDRPELEPPVLRLLAARAQFDEGVPVPTLAGRVDHPHEFVEVVPGDHLGEVHCAVVRHGGSTDSAHCA